MVPDPTLPPVGATSAGFILERSVPPTLKTLLLGAKEANERVRVTKTPPFSTNILVGQQGKERPMMCVQNATFAALSGIL